MASLNIYNDNTKRIAIIYTGLTRTIESTIAHFKENVLLNSSPNRHVFACLQLPNKDDLVISEFYDAFVKEHLGESLKSIQWFDQEESDWCRIKESALRDIQVSDYWKDYLRTSGSIVEYYQMYLVYQQIVAYEKANGIQYDYIMRTRCDIVLVHPIFFDWDTYTVNDIKSQPLLKFPVSKENLLLFMNSFYYCPRADSDIIKHYDDHIVSLELQHLLQITDETEFFEKFHEYFVTGKYMVTLRKNLVYFIKRQYFAPISELGITYGTRVLPKKSHWFDAESQLQTICVQNGLDIFDSTAELEGQSLYNYLETNYYDTSTGELIRSPCTMFFIKRR